MAILRDSGRGLSPRPEMGRIVYMPRPQPKPDVLTPGKRLKVAREALGYKKAAPFARDIGINEQTYRNIERGRNEANYDQLALFVSCGISLEWLVLGIAPALNIPSRQNRA